MKGTSPRPYLDIPARFKSRPEGNKRPRKERAREQVRVPNSRVALVPILGGQRSNYSGLLGQRRVERFLIFPFAAFVLFNFVEKAALRV